MILTISNLKMENESVVSERTKYAHLTEVETEIEIETEIETEIEIVAVALRVCVKATK
jgi:hypothetical protein